MYAPNIFSMPAPTLEKAIANKQLSGFPCENIEDIRRHLPPSPATPKGRTENLEQVLEAQGRTVNLSIKNK